MITTIEELLAQKADRPMKTMVVAAAEDKDVLEVVFEAYHNKIVQPLLVGDTEKIRALLDELGETLPDEWLVPAADPVESGKTAVQLVREGKADILMKGMMQTADFMRPVVNKEHGLNTGGVISLVSINEIPGYHKLLTITDCGITANPNLEQKKGILLNAVNTLRNLGWDNPKVAALSASEVINPKIPDSMDAAALAEMNREGVIENCLVEGPISMDIALSEKTAKKKGFESQIAGDPDVLLMPSVLAGNLAIKLLGRFVAVKTVSVVAGAAVPLVLTSRGVPHINKYRAICLAAAAAGSREA